VLLLVLANLAYWAYTRGHLEAVGLVPFDPREPHRLAAQVAPEALVVLNPARPVSGPVPAPVPEPVTESVTEPVPEPAPEATPMPASAPAEALAPPAPAMPTAPAAAPESAPVEVPAPVVAAPKVAAPAPATSAAAALPARPVPPTCWQATGLTKPQEILVRAALDHMDGMAGLWRLTEGVLPARWIVYLGPFPNEAAMQQRRAELRQANVEHRAITTPSLTPGLALGTFSTQQAAERTLATVTRQGVSGARVMQERPDTPLYTLTLEGVTDAQRRRIEATGILRDRPLQRCP